jgi:hypothetical protein
MENKILVARVHPAQTSMHAIDAVNKGIRNKQAHLRFRQEQKNKCKYVSSKECILILMMRKI